MRFWFDEAHPGQIYEQSKRILAQARAPDDTIRDATDPCHQERDVDLVGQSEKNGLAGVGTSKEESCPAE